MSSPSVAISGPTLLDGTLPDCPFPTNYGTGTPGTGGLVPHLTHSGGTPREGNANWAMELQNGRGGAIAIPDLMELQIKAYDQFLQKNVHWSDRDNIGLEAILQEIFPIESYDKKIVLEYIGYDLGRPRYSTEECRQLKLTFGAPFQ